MITGVADALGVSTGVAYLLLALIVVQLALQVFSLVDLVRRPRVRFDMKWLWAAAIILGGNMLLGPILYWAFGRSVPGQVEVDTPADSGDASAPGASGGDRTRAAVDALYGEQGGGQ